MRIAAALLGKRWDDREYRLSVMRWARSIGVPIDVAAEKIVERESLGLAGGVF